MAEFRPSADKGAHVLTADQLTALNVVTIRRLGAVWLPGLSETARPHGAPAPSRASVHSPSSTAALATLARLGYALSAQTSQAVQASDNPEALWAVVNAAALLRGEAQGSAFRPFYPDFPAQVAEAGQIELALNAAVHYFGDVIGLRLVPAPQGRKRAPLGPEERSRTELGLATTSGLEGLTRALFTQMGVYSEQDRKDLAALTAFAPQPAPLIAIKENLAVLAVAFPGLDLTASFRTATDVLRLAVAMSGGDVSLAQPCRLRTFSRAERRMLLGMLDAVGRREDLERWAERWKRLAHHLRPSDYATRYPTAARLLAQLASGRRRPGFSTKVEAHLAAKDVDGAVRLLRQRPGDFARRLNHLLRLCADAPARSGVVDAFAQVADRVSVPVLVRVWEYFASPGADLLARTVVPIKAGTSRRTALIDSTHRSTGADAQVMEAVEEALRRRGALGRIALEAEAYTGYVVPTGTRSLSAGLRTAGRGSRLPLPEAQTLRFFLHWRDIDPGDAGDGERVDLDLSAYFVNEDLTRTEDIAYYHLRGSAAVHSGDLTSAPQGAAEYIDVDMRRALRARWRYVVTTVHSYTRQPLREVPDCWAGVMPRDIQHHPSSQGTVTAASRHGSIYESSEVTQRLSLTAPGTVATPMVVDLAARRLIWWDSSFAASSASLINLDRTRNTLHAHLMSLLHSRRMELSHLLRLLADEVVEPHNKPDLVFGYQGIQPWQSETILALIAPPEQG